MASATLSANYQGIRLALGPRLGTDVSNQIHKWLRSSGVTWTVARLKNLYQVALQLRAGNRSMAVEIMQTNSIAYHKKSCIPKGPLGVVVKGFVGTVKEQCLRRYAGVLRLYTLFSKSQATSLDLKKHHDSIVSPAALVVTKNDYRSAQIERLAESLRKSFNGFWGAAPPKLTDFKPHKNSHYGEEKEMRKLGKMIPTGESEKIPYYNQIRSLFLTKPPNWVPQYFRDHGQPALAELADLQLSRINDNSTGHISILCDRGLKTRAVAVPRFWEQLVFMPLHRALDGFSQTLGPSVAHDQNLGAYDTIAMLEKYQPNMACFDLSSATDRFPLGWQLALLRGLGREEWCDRLLGATRGWMMEGKCINYEVGQPMGLYCSFPLFHVTHIVFIMTLCQRFGYDPQDSFRVLGDDVVIFEPKLAEAYQHELETYGIPISRSKSIASNRLAEFAGFLISEIQGRGVAFRPYKWGCKAVSRESCFALVHFLGLKAPSRGPIRYTRYYNEYMEQREYLYPDLSPMVPSSEAPGKTGPSIDFTRLRLLVAQFLEGLYPERVPSDFYQEIALELLGNCNVSLDMIEEERGKPRPYTAVSPERVEEDDFANLLSQIGSSEVGGKTSPRSVQRLDKF